VNHWIKNREVGKSTELTPWSRFLPEKLTGCQLLMKFPSFIKPENSLPHSQEPAISSNALLNFRNLVRFCSEELLARYPNSKQEYHPLCTVRDSLQNIFAASFCIGNSFIPLQNETRRAVWQELTYQRFSNSDIYEIFPQRPSELR